MKGAQPYMITGIVTDTNANLDTTSIEVHYKVNSDSAWTYLVMACNGASDEY